MVRLPRAGQDIDRARLGLDELGAPGVVRPVAGSAVAAGVVLLSIPVESEVPQRVAEAPGAAVSGIGQHDPARQATAWRI